MTFRTRIEAYESGWRSGNQYGWWNGFGWGFTSTLLAAALTLIIASCVNDRPYFIEVNEDGPVLISGLCADSIAPVEFICPDYTFENPTVGYITNLEQTSDTFYFEGVVIQDAYVALQNRLLSDGVVSFEPCEGTIAIEGSGGVTQLSISGALGISEAIDGYWIFVETPDGNFGLNCDSYEEE